MSAARMPGPRVASSLCVSGMPDCGETGPPPRRSVDDEPTLTCHLFFEHTGHMPMEKPPAGTRGARTPPSFVNKLVMPIMMRIHRRGGDRFQGMDLLYLTTVGARSGQQRTNPVARFDDGHGGWHVVASAGGAAQHPAWYHNIAAHPDQVWVEFGGKKHRVKVEQF